MFAAFLGISWFLWEGVNFKLAALKMGEFSAQSSLDVEFLLKLWFTLYEIHVWGAGRILHSKL